MGITRPPRSEQRRSQVYTAETVTPVDSNVAPTLLPSLATETSSPRSSSLDGSPQSAIRRSAARRDISLTRDDVPPRPTSSQADANGSSSRPHTPRSSGAGGSHRGSPDIWSQSHARTPTGGSLDSRDLTPRQASPHTPRQTSSPTSSLHSPPVLLTRSALSSRYSSPTQSTSFRTRTPSAEQAAPAPPAKAEHTSSGSEYSLDDDSSESQGWAGIDDEPMSSSPPRSPLLAQTLTEARQHQSFVVPMQDDAVEHIDQVEHVRRSSSAISLRLGGRNGSIDAGATADSEEGSRRSSVTDARRAASTPHRMSVAEEKGQDVAWWNAGVVEQLADPLEPVDSASQAEFHTIVSGAPPEVDPKASPQVGSAVDWDESKPGELAPSSSRRARVVS